METTNDPSRGPQSGMPGDLDLEARFAAFLAVHPTRSFELGEVTWTYRPAGAGSEGLVLLPGAAGGGEAYFLLAEELADGFHMVMIEYPPVSGLDAMLDGLVEILRREGIERTALLGGSFGGMVAQAFLLRFPERTTRVVLSATAPPLAERAPANERWLRRLRFVPMSFFRGLMRLVIRKLTRGVTVGRSFWRRYYLRAIDGWGRERLESQYRVSIDFDGEYGGRVAGLTNWPGQILILAGSEDRVASTASLEGLQTAYPQARVHTLEGAGHGLSLERPDEWRAAVTGFLARDP